HRPGGLRDGPPRRACRSDGAGAGPSPWGVTDPMAGDEPEIERTRQVSPPAARIVRPYALTAGRTRPVVDLPLEATLRLDTSATRRAWSDDVQGKIVAVCD